MQELDKILEEIDGMIERYKENPRLKIVDICYGLNQAKRIIRKHMNGGQCGECSRRKWYQKGYEDGKKDRDGWIPVEEQLPKEYGEYLVTIVPSAGYLWAKRIIANFSDLMGIVKKPIFYTGEVGKIDFEDITGMVIAWNPLPEPYQPERSDNHDGE